jgi:uncharacterized repeat protein (TIGR02543 family)
MVMKSISHVLMSLIFIILWCLSSLVSFAQLSSRATGNWGSSSTWDAWNSRAAKTGTITITSGSAAVTGIGTLLNTELAAANVLEDASGNVLGTISTITDATNLTLSANATVNYTGSFYLQRIPTLSDDVTIASGDSVEINVGAVTRSLTIKSGAKLTRTGAIEGGTGGVTGPGTFTIESNGWFYQNSANKWPQLYTTYNIDPNSYYVQTTSSSSSMLSFPPYIMGNMIIYKSGGVLIAVNTCTSVDIKGSLIINIAGTNVGLKLSNNKSTAGAVNTIHVGGNVNIISGYLSAVDNQTMKTTVTVDGNIIVGDASTAPGVAILAGTSAAIATQRTAVWNIGGNLSFVNGGILRPAMGTGATTDAVTFNLKGNLSTDAAATQANATVGLNCNFNFMGIGTQTITLGSPFKFASAAALTLCDTIASTSHVVFNGSRRWASTTAGSVNGPGQWVVNGGLTFGTDDTLGGIQAFTLNSGATLTTANANGLTSNGNIQLTGTQTYSTGANYGFTGTVAQATGALFPSTANNLNINNASGVSLTGSTLVNGVLLLNSGNVVTGANTLAIGSAGSVLRTSGQVVGNLQKNISTGATSSLFEIGDASNYTPVSVAFGSVSNAGVLKVSTTPGLHPQIGTSGLNSNKTLNRYYTLTNSGIVFDQYGATLNFASADVIGGANTANYIVKKYDGAAWSTLATVNPLATSIQTTNNTSFSDFVVGEIQKTTFTLTTNAVHGYVVADPEQTLFDSSAVVQLTATPDPGYHFTGWSGDLSGTTNPITVTMNANKNITANFSINVYRIFSSADATGAIYPHGDMYVNYGDSITFRMEPGAYCHITGVYVDGNPVGAVETYTLRNITADHEVWAGFQFDMYTITATADPHGSISPSGSVVAMGGFGSSFSIRPNPSYHIADVLVDGSSVGPVSSYDFPLVDSDHSIHASFAINTFTLSVNATNGTVTKNPDQPAYDSASTVQLTAVPAAGYTFTSWSGDLTGTTNPVTITMNANKTITANFALNAVTTFTLTVNANPPYGGTVTKSPDAASYDSATVVTVTAIANTGYHFVNWTGAVSGITNPVTITMTSPKAVTANFISDTISLSISVSAGWNLLSVPLLMKNPFPPIVFPGSFGDAFQPTESGYKTVDTVKVGRGYFVYFTAPRFITFTGVPVKGSIVIPLGIGWNLVGSREVTVDASSLVTVPSGRIYGDLFFYNASASTYYTKTQIFPGDGEWLYVIGSCTLTLP